MSHCAQNHPCVFESQADSPFLLLSGLQKPDNLLMDGSFDGQGGVPIVKVADFGLSKHKWKSYVSGVRDLR